MKQSEQLKLLKDCKSYMEGKFPELKGLWHIIPIEGKTRKWLFLPGFRTKTNQLQLMFVYRERVFFFYTAQTYADVRFYEYLRLTNDHTHTRQIDDLNHFVRKVRTLLARYGHENLGL